MAEKATENIEWLTYKSAAKYLELSVGTLRNYVKAGRVPSRKNPMTGSRRFLKSELDEFMNQGYEGPGKIQKLNI